MKKMKKLLSVCLATTMLFSVMSFGASAAGVEDDASFNITTTIGDNHQIVRVYENNSISDNAVSTCSDNSTENIDYAETKELLLELGMEQYAIDNLTEEDLERYSNSPKIVATVSYSKVDENNNVIYLSEDVAIEEAEEVAQNENARIQNALNGIQTVDQNTYQDSYMRVFFMTTYLGDGQYTFSTDARWLTMPAFRWTDVIGASAQHCTVDPDTRSGYVEYDRLLIGAGVNTTTPIHSSLSSSLFDEASDGTFYGSGAKIDLPYDAINTTGTSLYYQNYKAHYQYNGYVLDPSTAHRFNALGNYSHSRATIAISPSISIGADGVAGALGISGLSVQDVRKVLLQIYYQ